MLTTDMRRMKIAVGVTGTGVVDRDIGSRDEAGLQHGCILRMKAIPPLCQAPHHMALGDHDTAVDGTSPDWLRRDLPILMHHPPTPKIAKASCVPKERRKE